MIRMCPIHFVRRFLLAVLTAVLLAVVGLLVAGASTLAARGACATASPTPVPTPSAVPTPLQVVSDSFADLAPKAVIVQLAYEGGLTSMEEGQPFGRVPPFTLYADGRMIWVPVTPPRRVLEATLSAADIAVVLQQVYDRGFGHLESYTSHCRLDSAGNGECVEDAGLNTTRTSAAPYARYVRAWMPSWSGTSSM